MTAGTRKKIKTAAKVDVYQVVTDRILEALEAGYFTVFNADQCDGELRIPEIDDTLEDHEPIEVCQAITTRYLATGDGPTLDHGGNRAFYSPARDAVRMPLIGQFESPEAYHSTLFHELVHSTGHSSRIARPSLVEPTPFGTPDYSRDELVAEMGAAFLCGEAGIDVNYPQHAAYLDSWMKALRDDAKLLVQAAGAAQKAADLIVGQREETTTDDGEES